MDYFRLDSLLQGNDLESFHTLTQGLQHFGCQSVPRKLDSANTNHHHSVNLHEVHTASPGFSQELPIGWLTSIAIITLIQTSWTAGTAEEPQS